jgi:hypothetical protein
MAEPRVLPNKPGTWLCREYKSKLIQSVEVVWVGAKLCVRRQGLPLITNPRFEWVRADAFVALPDEVVAATTERDALKEAFRDIARGLPGAPEDMAVASVVSEALYVLGRAPVLERDNYTLKAIVDGTIQRLHQFAEEMPEHVYQELASALEAPPRSDT